MTIIGALKIKKFYGVDLDQIILFGDSRLTRPTNKESENGYRKDESYIVSTFDSAQKVIPISPNILIGLAGDYRVVTLLSPLIEKINTVGETGIPIFQLPINQIKDEIYSYMTINFKREEWDSVDLFIIIKDFHSNKKELFKLLLPTNGFASLEEGLHLIGESAIVRSDFHKQFLFNRDEIHKYNQGKDITDILVVTLGATLENFNNYGVGGRFHCFIMSNEGWINKGTAQIYDETNTILATALGVDGITTQLNGVNVELLTSDWATIDKYQNKYTKSVLKTKEGKD